MSCGKIVVPLQKIKSMAKSLSLSPYELLFTLDGVQYQISERAGSGVSGAPIALSFEVIFYDASARYYRNSAEITILSHAELNRRSMISLYEWKVDLTDILSAYAKRLTQIGDYIHGYATVQLTKIDDSDTDLDETEHYCLFGSSGGLDLSDYAEFDTNIHPFLLTRGSRKGTLSFYRSELTAMGLIYAIKTAMYGSMFFSADNRNDLSSNEYAISGRDELKGLEYYNQYNNDQDNLTDTNALYLHLIHTSGTASKNRIYTIAIQADPETDEHYIIRWTNSMGAPEALLLSGELKNISEAGQPDMYITEQSLRATTRKQKHSLQTTKYSLHTGYLTSDRIQALRDMLCSDEVEIQIDGEWIPVSVTADTKHAVHQREPEDFELTIEVLEQTRYPKLNRTVRALPDSRSGLLQDKDGNIILDNNSDTIH